MYLKKNWSIHLRARCYCPTTADFLTEDSYLGDISDPLTLNRYNYVKSSPLNYVDPSGHTVEDLIKQVKSTAFELNRDWNKAVHQGTKAFDSWFSNSMESIMNTARDACRTLDCEIADVTYSFTVGLVYSAVDNLIFQSGNALLELVGINSAYDSVRFREDMENWMLENAVPDERGFFAGQVVGDAFMTAEMLVKLPQILETIGKNLANITTTSSAVGYQLNPDGTIASIEGMGFSLAEAGVLVEEFGTAGALVVASFMSVTGIGNDSEKFTNALNEAASEKKITKSEHAQIRSSQGRNVNTAINDLNRAKPSNIYLQDDGRYVIKGANGRVHIMEVDGEIVTTMNNVTNFNKRVSSGRYVSLTESQKIDFARKFGSYLNSSWSSYK